MGTIAILASILAQLTLNEWNSILDGGFGWYYIVYICVLIG